MTKPTHTGIPSTDGACAEPASQRRPDAAASALASPKPFVDDGDLLLYHGDAITVLQSLPAGIAQTCVTSPPYWGLRDYGTGTWTGGDEACDHKQRANHDHAGNVGDRNDEGNAFRNSSRYVDQGDMTSPTCRCGAQRVDDQLGLEATPQEYVERIVSVFREVRRVLRDDGTLWLNLGDSYAANTASTRPPAATNARGGLRGAPDAWTGRNATPVKHPTKPKDLVGIPWRVAFALQADGWYLRSDIIWSKPNPMPESVTDRPTKAHEYLFLFSKQPRYYMDMDAIREDQSKSTAAEWYRMNRSGGRQPRGAESVGGSNNGLDEPKDYAGRNRRSVWVIPTEPFPEAHFATYPQELVRPCILAGSSVGATVLDPFIGSGTTALVARKHGRRCIGIDLSTEYLAIAAKRTQQLSLLGGPVEPEPSMQAKKGLTGGAYSPPGQSPHSNARKEAS